jgi:hypothetical protein
MKTVFSPARARATLGLLTMSSALVLSACGGGGGGLAGGLAGAVTTPPGSGGGIGGTGLSTTGTVDGTGSIFVNGVRFVVDEAEIRVNGEPAREEDLGLGMVVTVVGTIEDDGESGTADRVSFDAALDGPVSELARDADNSSVRLRILGQVVLAERTGTVYAGTTFDSIAVGDSLEVSGYRDGDGRLRATRIAAGEGTRAALTGTVSALEGRLFRIDGQLVDATSADLGDLPGSALENGLAVAVDGELIDGTLVAAAVAPGDSFERGLQPDEDVTVQGTISAYEGPDDFAVAGLPVAAGSAVIADDGLPLAAGVVVEVSGVWDGSRVIADRVSVRRGRIELAAPVAAIDTDSRTLRLQFGTGTVTVGYDSRTLFDDDRDDLAFLTAGDLAIGDYLEIEALPGGGAELLATRVDRDEPEDETELQAPVSSFVDGVSVTLLGLSYDLTGAEFENAGDAAISAAEFFANLGPGTLVRVRDDEPADGFAETVEFEFATALKGERGFLDDDEERIGAEQLPAPAAAYLAQNFPRAGIAFIERDDEEIEVYLTDGTEVVFDLAGGFVESDIDDDGEDSEDGDPGDDVPEEEEPEEDESEEDEPDEDGPEEDEPDEDDLDEGDSDEDDPEEDDPEED